MMRRKVKNCNCKNSRCLKLYCECFASGSYCEPGVCNCLNCFNNRDSEQLRAEAVEATLERNPSAFRPKIAPGPSSGVAVRHHKGCNCKKSGCLKKYCECFQAGIMCSEACKCVDCRNYEGCPDLHTAGARGGGGGTSAKKRAKIDYVPAAPPVAGRVSGRTSGLTTRAVAAEATQVAGGGGKAAGRTLHAPAPTVPPPPAAARLPATVRPPPVVPPQAAPVAEFGAVTEDTLKDECAKLLAALGDDLPVASPDAERKVLATILGTLRSHSGKVAAKLQA